MHFKYKFMQETYINFTVGRGTGIKEKQLGDMGNPKMEERNQKTTEKRKSTKTQINYFCIQFKKKIYIPH